MRKFKKPVSVLLSLVMVLGMFAVVPFTVGAQEAATGHNMTAHPAVAPMLIVEGNSAYWSCDRCGKYFSDENGETEIAPGSWVLAATGVAEVNGVKYETLQAALDAAAEGATVKLLSDIKVTSAVTVSKKVTLDLNGGSIINVGVTNRAYEKNQKK